MPTSFAQQRLWFLDQLQPGNASYVIPTAVRLTGRLNSVALGDALNILVDRHESLRTTFVAVEGQPMQRIEAQSTLSLREIDLSHLSSKDRDKQVDRLFSAEANHTFSLAQGPLLRCTLLRLAEDQHILLLILHHIIADGWSIAVLIRELVTCYDASCKGRDNELPALPIQYADYAHWQSQWLQGQRLEQQLGYWKKRFSDLPPVLALPTDLPRPPVQSHRGAIVHFTLSRGLSKALETMSLRQGATLFMTTLAAFYTLLSRYTGQRDLCVGTPIANRNRPEIEGLIGFFVNTLALRADLTDNPTFSELLQRVKQTTLQDFAHQDLPFEKLIEALKPSRDLSILPLFQVMFAFNNIRHATIELQELRLEPLPVDSDTAKFDLTLQLTQHPEQLHGQIEYASDLFEPTTIERLTQHYTNLLEAIVAAPVTRVSQLPLLSAAERRRLLHDWNATEQPYPRDQTLAALFENQVTRTPNAPALQCAGVTLSYADLNRRANQLAHRLQSLGVGPEVVVGICLNRSLELVIALLGVLKAGGAYLPLDPDYPAERLAFMLDDSAATLLMTETSLVEGLAATEIPKLLLDLPATGLTDAAADNPTPGACAQNLAYLIYTSGSTGRPKGVAVTQDSVINLAMAQITAFRIRQGSTVLQLASSSFDASVSEIFTALFSGAQLYLVRDGLRNAYQTLRDICARERGVVATLPPSVLATLDHTMQGLDTLVSAGEPCTLEIARRWCSQHRLINAYGPSEGTVCATMYQVDESPTRAPIPIGRAMANVQTYLLDAHLHPVPLGVTGELYLGGSGLARGYLGRPALTAERFLPNPFAAPGSRLYKTGDLARYQTDGNLVFLGRIDQQVKIRGFRIEPGEIEAALLAQPQVREALVLAHTDPTGSQRLTAYVVAPESSPSILRSALAGHLPEHMIPSLFILLETLPLTANGKVDRTALPAPNPEQRRTAAGYVAPRSSIERQLTNIWQGLLGIDRIGVRDNFFELGGHSLLCIRLLAEIESQIGRQISVTALFESPTIAEQALLLDKPSNAIPSSPSRLVLLRDQGHRHPLFLIHPGGGQIFHYQTLAARLDIQHPVYGVQALGVEPGELPHARIEQMATCYLEEIRAVQPAGPYLFCGWSIGAHIAYEMARQVHARGDCVDRLILIDPSAPAGSPDETETKSEVIDGVSLGSGLFPSHLKGDAAQTDSSDSAQRQAALQQIALANGFIPREAPAEYVERIIRVFDANVQALRHYRPDSYPGRAELLLAQKGQFNDASDGWRRLVRGGLNIHRIEGDHYAMLQPPQVDQLVSLLSTLLNEDDVSETQGEMPKEVDSGGPTGAYRNPSFNGQETSIER